MSCKNATIEIFTSLDGEINIRSPFPVELCDVMIIIIYFEEIDSRKEGHKALHGTAHTGMDSAVQGGG